MFAGALMASLSGLWRLSGQRAGREKFGLSVG